MEHCARAAPQPLCVHPLYGRGHPWQPRRYPHHAQAEDKQEVSLGYLENKHISSLTIRKIVTARIEVYPFIFKVSDLLLVMVAVPTQLLQYFSVQVMIY